MSYLSHPGTRWLSRVIHRSPIIALTIGGFTLVGCKGILDVDLPGRIPSSQVDDPALASVLVSSVIGDFECAYNNYTVGSAAQGDEYENANSNGGLSSLGTRSVTGDTDDYVVGGCEANTAGGSIAGLHVPLQTARFQAEDIFRRMSGWSDDKASSKYVPNRKSFLATLRAYGGYPYLLMGETFCSVAFSGGDKQVPKVALDSAVKVFQEAIALAADPKDSVAKNLALVGLARASMDLKDWPKAATAAAQVASWFTINADRGNESDRRWNKIVYFATQLGGWTVADTFRTLNDPRALVMDSGHGAFNPFTRLWVTTKYSALGDPIRLASYREAQLILAEARARQNDVPGAMGIINARRTALGLVSLTPATKEAAIAAIIQERRWELSFEGGHRLNDLLREGIAWKLGSAEYTGQANGTTTCWPFPTKESNGA